ncbi:HlyC/CorC family transporter [Ehrlichia japonica]|uniref:Transporter associated domain protein n=1 Tax=Ehrlichia japonica TaxID=391036 RepID=X5H1D7_9RICK|nr:CNNM domain-containing protein [Ehrlichia japonica]AHX04639.1 transporter associated domain protein [Ehrlichia japonica]
MGLLVTSVLSILILLILSAFFSAAETSITSISSSLIHKLMLRGNKRAQIINTLSQKKKLVINTVLIGNTIINITASSIATAIFIEILGPQGILLSTVIMTFFILIFSEALPKSYAILNPEKTALLISCPLSFCVLILSPITLSIQYMIDFILKILDMHKDKEIISAAEAMRNLISLHDSKGTMLKQDLDMLSSILDLAETEISQVMTHRKNLLAFNIDININDLIKKILASSHSRIPLWKNQEDQIIGVVHVKDVITLIREKGKNITQEDLCSVMTKPWFVPDTTLLSVQLHNFLKNRKHLALVIDEYGALQGIVTLEDVIEEIVGDITDEHDITTEAPIKQISENIYHINGFTSIRDINRQLRWNLPDEEASTLAGAIVYEVERIPEEGEEFLLYGLSFKILKKSGHTISNIQVNTSPQDISIIKHKVE